MPDATDQLHERATDLMLKALKMSPDQRVAFVNALLQHVELKDTELKRFHELVRKGCECRDKLAISLHTLPWMDPRQFAFDFGDISPNDFE